MEKKFLIERKRLKLTFRKTVYSFLVCECGQCNQFMCTVVFRAGDLLVANSIGSCTEQRSMCVFMSVALSSLACLYLLYLVKYLWTLCSKRSQKVLLRAYLRYIYIYICMPIYNAALERTFSFSKTAAQFVKQCAEISYL